MVSAEAWTRLYQELEELRKEEDHLVPEGFPLDWMNLFYSLDGKGSIELWTLNNGRSDNLKTSPENFKNRYLACVAEAGSFLQPPPQTDPLLHFFNCLYFYSAGSGEGRFAILASGSGAIIRLLEASANYSMWCRLRTTQAASLILEDHRQYTVLAERLGRLASVKQNTLIKVGKSEKALAEPPKRSRKILEPQPHLLKDRDIVNKRQAASSIGVSMRTLDRYIKDGQIVPIGGFGHKRFKTKDLVSFSTKKNRDN